MGPLDLTYHLLSFAAPALGVGLVLALLAPIFMPKRPAGHTVLAQAAINFIAGFVGLGLGLWFFGRDGKMASYGLMLLLCCVAQARSTRWGK